MIEAGKSGDTMTVLAPLQAVLLAAGYSTVEPSIVQDAAPFLDLGGEDIRARLYFTSDRSGTELCLRPEFTIPVCRSYLANAGAGGAARYSCAGPVFRFRDTEPDEFLQVGLESFGHPEIAAMDAEILALSLDAVSTATTGPLTTTFGDVGLLAALLDALDLPTTWQRRLKRGLDRGELPAAILAAAPARGSDNQGVLSALAKTDAAGARALVDDLLSIAGIASVGGRSAAEIAERFLEQVALRAAPSFGNEKLAVLDRFLAVRGVPDAAAADLRRLSREAGLDLTKALDLFEERVSFMAAQEIDLDRVTFSGAFSRNLDYYTGFVFESGRVGLTAGSPVITGGRYDRLAQALGSPAAVPAVGAAIWVERLWTTAQGGG